MRDIIGSLELLKSFKLKFTVYASYFQKRGHVIRDFGFGGEKVPLPFETILVKTE